MNKQISIIFILIILFLIINFCGCIENKKEEKEDIFYYVPDRNVKLQDSMDNKTISNRYNITWAITSEEIPSENARKQKSEKDDILLLYYSYNNGTTWNLIINWSQDYKIKSNTTKIPDGLWTFIWDTSNLNDGIYYQIKIEAYLPNKSEDISKYFAIKNN